MTMADCEKHLRELEAQRDVEAAEFRNAARAVRAATRQGRYPAGDALLRYHEAARSYQDTAAALGPARRELAAAMEAEWLAGRAYPDGRPRSEVTPR